MAEFILFIDNDGIPQELCPPLLERMQKLLTPYPLLSITDEEVQELSQLAQALPVAIQHDRTVTEMTTIVQDRWIESGEALSPRDLSERLGYSVAFCRKVLHEFSPDDLTRRNLLMKDREG